MARILVVDDQPSICYGLQKVLEGAGHAVKSAASAEAGLELLPSVAPDVVFLDLWLPGISGLSALPQFLASGAKVVVITAHGTVETAVEALRAGAFEYLLKPFGPEQVRDVVARAAAPSPEAPAVAQAVAELRRSPGRKALVGNTPPMQTVYRQIATVALGPSPVMLFGESGTGKELVALEIHRAAFGPGSGTGGQPGAGGTGSGEAHRFVPINLAALPSTLVEAELFGYSKGAFTGATQDRPGLFEEANGGTLFLDEIGDMPLDVQPKLLRALETGEVRRLGTSNVRHVSCRVIGATHRDLPALVKAGQFREDLYYRLGVFTLTLPPLRERLADLPLLVAHFMLAFSDRRAAVVPNAPPPSAGAVLGATQEFMNRLMRHAWAGNVRELRNVVEHAMVAARGQRLDVPHLPAYLHDKDSPAPLLDSLVENLALAHLAASPEGTLYEAMVAAMEEPLLRLVMKNTNGNQVQAAKILGIHRGTLKTKLDHYHVDPKGFGDGGVE